MRPVGRVSSPMSDGSHELSQRGYSLHQSQRAREREATYGRPKDEAKVSRNVGIASTRRRAGRRSGKRNRGSDDPPRSVGRPRTGESAAGARSGDRSWPGWARRLRGVLSELRTQKRIRFSKCFDAIRLLLGSCLYQCLQDGESLQERSSLFWE